MRQGWTETNVTTGETRPIYRTDVSRDDDFATRQAKLETMFDSIDHNLSPEKVADLKARMVALEARLAGGAS